MPTYVAFLRAVNVKPRMVKMEQLRKHLSDNGFRDVETHIASGNVLVTTPLRSAAKVRDTLHDLLSAEFGFDIPVVVRTPKQLRALAAEVDALTSPLGADARVYVAFSGGSPAEAGRRLLEEWDGEGERAVVHGDHAILWLTVPAHSTKLDNKRVEKAMGHPTTTRDLKVVRALADKWGA